MKMLIGKVTSNKMQKTVVVEIEQFKIHPIYRKRLKRTRRFHAHDEKGAKVGDRVKVVEIKPISKLKHWRVEEII